MQLACDRRAAHVGAAQAREDRADALFTPKTAEMRAWAEAFNAEHPESGVSWQNVRAQMRGLAGCAPGARR